jgi:hypothetical protein
MLPPSYDKWRLAGLHDDACPDCNGGYLIDCPDCDGHGCDECMELGEIPCPACCSEEPDEDKFAWRAEND